jgi:acyl carrier protein
MQELVEEIRGVVVEVCHPETPDVSDEAKSLLDSGLDSLDFASVLMALEEKYVVSLSEAEIETLLSIRQIAEYITAQKGTG